MAGGSFPTDANLHITRHTTDITVGAHPEYNYWKPVWCLLRDCVIGEYEIKRKGTTYLPRLSGHDEEEYLGYLDRAYFYNMTYRTINGLMGTLFRKEPKVQNVVAPLLKGLKNITKTGTSISSFAKEIASEVLTVGRFGVLLDMDEAGNKPPFLVGYTTENIVDWTVAEVDSRFVLKEVVLREIKSIKNQVFQRGVNQNRMMSVGITTYEANYRILRLDDDNVYRQYVYENSEEIPTGERTLATKVLTPVQFGKPFDFIPFVFFGPQTNSPSCEKPPVSDIAHMNLSHYQSAAQLEHGRFYTAMPVYHINVKTPDDTKQTYTVGPSVVWEYDGDKAPGILEYNGHGLGSLQTSLDMKEQHISALGGRMLGVRTTAVAESDNLVKLKEKNEQSLLLNLSTTINIGLSTLLNWWSNWQGVPSDNIQMEMNQDFLFEAVSAREYRAFALLYKEGIIPIEVLYNTLRKAEVIPEYMDLEEFKKQIQNVKNFPNNPDVEAKQEGYPDAAAKLREEAQEKDRKSEEKIAAMNKPPEPSPQPTPKEEEETA
jgi:hypothetical protein